MSLIQILILSIIEGLTEFLPVSSTTHLIIAQKVFGFAEVNEFITVVLQLGAILAAVYFFRKRIISILQNSLTNLKKALSRDRAFLKQDLGVWILISIIPVLVAGFIFKDVETLLQNSLLVIAFNTIVFGIIFYVIQKATLRSVAFIKTRIDANNLSFKNVFVMGLFQILALLPGVSRSGITISGGLFEGITFQESIEISFIMSIPVMLAASAYELLKTLHGLNSSIIILTVIGMVVTFITGLLSIKFTVGFLAKVGFLPFMVYRILLGIGIVVVFLILK